MRSVHSLLLGFVMFFALTAQAGAAGVWDFFIDDVAWVTEGGASYTETFDELAGSATCYGQSGSVISPLPSPPSSPYTYPNGSCYFVTGNSLTSQVVSGIATFSSGELIEDSATYPLDQSVIYGTTGVTNHVAQNLCLNCTDPLTIDFSSPVTSVSLYVINGMPDFLQYLVSDNNGDSETETLSPNTISGDPAAEGLFTLTSNYPITSVSIGTVPEPGASLLLGIGLSGLWALRRRISTGA